jgi:tetratricopeptide (TPR) repeat protein
LRQETEIASRTVQNIDLAALFQRGQVLNNLLLRLAKGELYTSPSEPSQPSAGAKPSQPSLDAAALADLKTRTLAAWESVPAIFTTVNTWWQTVAPLLGLTEDRTSEGKADAPGGDHDNTLAAWEIVPVIFTTVGTWWQTVAPLLGLTEDVPRWNVPTSVDQTSEGKAYFRGGDYEKALAAFQAIRREQLEPQDRTYVEYLIATCLRKLKKPDEARKWYSKVAESKDRVLVKYAQWQLLSLQRQDELQRRDDALKQLESAPSPPPPVDHMAAAKACFRAGDYEKALEAFKKIPLDQQDAEDGLLVRYLMATCYRRLGESEKNDAKLDEAMKLYSELENATSTGQGTVARYASWQLKLMQWKKDLQAQERRLE